MKRKKFDNIAFTRRNALVTALAPALIALFFSSAIVPHAEVLALALMVSYLIANAKSWNFIFKNSVGNSAFSLYSLAITFLNATMVALGAGLVLIGQVLHRITGNDFSFIIRFIKCYFSRRPQDLIVRCGE
jgi:hypothetical protein